MSNNPKASVHVKPCNIAQSELHNRRDPEYIKKLDPNTLYVRLDLTKHNASYVAPEMNGRTLKQHLESIRVMVKQKTGRALQEKEVKYPVKGGKMRTRQGASPIREGVVVIEKDTKLKDILRFTHMVEKEWGIKALEVHLHRDEGHNEVPGDENTWVPNYHAHIIWDWMDWKTGKSIKLNADDMSTMQDMVAEALDMERGQKKSETGLDHLERNDFILQKQEKEKKRLEEEKEKVEKEAEAAKSKAQQAKEEKVEAEKEAKEAKSQAQQAKEEKDEAEKKAEAAKAELSTFESKVTKRQAKIDKMDEDIEDRSARFEALNDMIADSLNEKYAMDISHKWKDAVLTGLSATYIQADETVEYCIDAIKDYACSGTGCRGGRHGSCLWDEEASAIKKVMTYLAKAFKTTLQEIGDWLVWAANRIYKFNALELRRADSEVKDVADGRYDWRIERIDRGQGGGISR